MGLAHFVARHFGPQALHKRPAFQTADLLPWGDIIDDGTVVCKDGSLVRFAEYCGPDLDSLTAADQEAFARRVNGHFLRLGSGWAVWCELTKRATEAYPRIDWQLHKASALLDREQRDGYIRVTNRFVSRYTLALHYLPPPDLQNRLAALFVVDDRKTETSYKPVIDKFLRDSDTWFDGAERIFPHFRVLGPDAIFEHLYGITNDRAPQLTLPGLGIGLDYLCACSTVNPGWRPMIGDNHLRVIGLKGYPNDSIPAMLTAIDRLALPIRFSVRWIALNRSDAADYLNKQRTRWYTKRKGARQFATDSFFDANSPLDNPESGLRVDEARDALKDSAQARSASGICTLSVIVTGLTEGGVDEAARTLVTAVNNAGFTAHVETANAFDAWHGTLPGAGNSNARQPVLSTHNFAHLAPLQSIWPGEPVNRHLNGPALLYATTAQSATFRVNLHDTDLGHTLVIGPTGAGKSFLNNVFSLAWLRYPGARIIGVDKDGSSRATTLAAGGHFFDLSDPSRCPGFQPLRQVHQHSVRAWALTWIAQITRDGAGIEPTAVHIEEIDRCLKLLERFDLAGRTLSRLADLIQVEAIKDALRPYTGTGPYAYLFDRANDVIQDHFWQVFELGHIHGNAKLARIVMGYLFHRAEQAFDPRFPTYFFAEEAWIHLDSPEMAERFREYLKTLRKFNVSLILLTQSLDDIQRSTIAQTIFQNVATKILLPNAKATSLDVRPLYQAIGLNQRQMELLAEAIPKSDYYFLQAKGARLFSIPSGPVTKALCGATDRADHLLIDQILETHGPDRFFERFMAAKGVALPEAA